MLHDDGSQRDGEDDGDARVVDDSIYDGVYDGVYDVVH